jgi:hypothetical protein
VRGLVPELDTLATWQLPPQAAAAAAAALTLDVAGLVLNIQSMLQASDESQRPGTHCVRPHAEL